MKRLLPTWLLLTLALACPWTALAQTATAQDAAPVAAEAAPVTGEASPAAAEASPAAAEASPAAAEAAPGAGAVPGPGDERATLSGEGVLPETAAAGADPADDGGLSFDPQGPPTMENAPFVGDLLLDDPAWAELKPADQLTAVRRRLESVGEKDPLAPQLHLTLAWLLDTQLPGKQQEAAEEYAALQRFQQDYAFAPQAMIRAGEIYTELSRGEDGKRFEKQARKPYDALVTMLQRDIDAIKLWERTEDGWREVADEYGFVLQKIDALARDQAVYKLIDFLVKLTGNIPGWSQVLALIILALVLKGLAFPLTQKSYRSMAEMQRLQPLIDELRKRHKDNPQKLNEEMMRIYREHGVNPLGGCLPMLIQMPVFIVVYQGIRAYTYHYHNVEFLWLDSLAAPDTILLLVYGVSMFFQQKITMAMQPPAADPQQAQMQRNMALMTPILFTYMMWIWKLPSAFYLYWLTFNVLSTLEQVVVRRKTAPGMESPLVAPATVLDDVSARPHGGSRPQASRKGRQGKSKAGRKRSKR